MEFGYFPDIVLVLRDPIFDGLYLVYIPEVN
jgi:hypothetical protein